MSFTIENFNVTVEGSGNSRLDGERVGQSAMEYMNAQLARVMA